MLTLFLDWHRGSDLSVVCVVRPPEGCHSLRLRVEVDALKRGGDVKKKGFESEEYFIQKIVVFKICIIRNDEGGLS